MIEGIQFGVGLGGFGNLVECVIRCWRRGLQM